MINPTEPSPESVHYRGAFVCARRLDIENLLKFPLIYNVSYFWGVWGFVWRGKAHQCTPVATGLNPPELPISDEAQNNAHIASTGVKLCINEHQGCHIKK